MTKPIIANIIVAFAFFSIGFFIGKENATVPTTPQTTVMTPANTTATTPNQAAALDEAIVKLYYFHGNMRCKKCMLFEEYSTELVKSEFADTLKSGALVFQVINVDEPANAHFNEDFELSTRSLVIVRADGSWKNLEEIWDKVGEKTDFLAYVRTELKSAMEKKQ